MTEQQFRELLDLLPPEQIMALLAVTEAARDSKSFEHEIMKHPELRSAVPLLLFLGSGRSDAPTGLEPTLRELSLPAKNPSEMSKHIELCRLAVGLVRREEDAKLWASLHLELGISLTLNPTGNPSDDLDESVSHFRQALEVFGEPGYPHPEQLSLTLHSIGTTYLEDNLRGDRQKNIEEAITYLEQEQAIVVKMGQTDAKRWVISQFGLGNAYCQRKRGQPAQNIEKGIRHYEQALAACPQQTFPDAWASIQNNLANAYNKRIRGLRAGNIEQAISHYGQALAVYTREAYPESWAMIHYNLAAAYRERLLGERAENIETEISHYDEALAVYTQEAYPVDWAGIEHNLATAYRTRLVGDRAENIEKAIEFCEQALKVRSREAYPSQWGATQTVLGNAYAVRLRGQREKNLEQAITCYESAIEVFGSKADPQGWARLQNNLAISYAQRLIGNPIENVEQCIAHLKVALKAASKKVYPREWAMTQHNLGNAHTLLRGRGRENLKNAIACFKRALEVRTLDQFPVDYQQTQAALGSVYFGKRQWSPAVAAYREAMRAERALLAAAFTETGQLAEMAETKELYARTAYALLKLRRPGDALAQLEQGKARLLSRALALNDVDLSFLPTNEQETIRSLRRTIRALEAEMRLPPDTRGRRDDLTLAETLDKSRAQLEEAIKGIRQTHPDFIPEVLDVAEILALIPHDGVLVAPVITSHGSAVFVVPTGMQSVAADQVLWLEHFKELDLQALLMGSDAETRQSGWLWSYANARSDAKRWLDTIETTGQVLWDRFLAQVTERLVSLGAKHILLMPQGGLGLLPVHAAWRDIDQTRRYFIDDYSVSYVPSAYARSVSHTRLRDARRRTRTLLAVVNPTEDLQFTPIEGEQIASLFGQENSTVLPGSKATSEAVVQGLANYIHFACHGFYRWGDPMQSGLVLAKKKPLTLAQIKGRLSLEKTRLVTLSACETGITDIRQLPDEYLGLPVGFLQVGAPAVVSSLWAVNDLSTMLLMERFYQLHLHDAKDLPDALCGAQCWLRDVTAAELAKRFADEEEAALVGKGRMPLELASEYFLRFAQQNPVHQPFGHPYHWAAFTFSGA